MKQAELAAIRFGYGLGRGNPADGPKALLQSLQAPDRVAQTHPMMGEDEAGALYQDFGVLQKASRADEPGAEEAFKAIKNTVARNSRENLRLPMARILDSQSPLLERLVAFWADHFTARPRSNRLTLYVQPYLDQTLRPHVTGRFADMLKAVAQSPLMLSYLDQNGSVGPGSAVGQKQDRGLNENLAREMLELHTLGVGGGYAQADVRQLAELLTGLDFRAGQGFSFRARFAEPGAETVLGVDYGGGKPQLSDILDALDALAVHPDTARHIGRKLAVHFVSDTPDPALVEAIAGAFQDSGGDLMATYEAMLNHPAAWTPELAKTKQPYDFIASSLTALGISGKDLRALPVRQFYRHVTWYLKLMGQDHFRAPGPDGWPEDGEAWITPQGLASRIRWAQNSPRRLVDPLPDPRDFLTTALGSAAPERLERAVRGAESQVQGVALVLSSPTFNRR